MTNERQEKNRRLSEWLFGRNLDGFGIYSKNGSRLRERDFDSRDEAQRYIDSEDERLPESQKSSAKGVNIQPCVKAHPDFYTDESANAMLLEKMRRPLLVSDWPGCKGWRVDIGVQKLFARPLGPTRLDRKEAIAEAALAYIAHQEERA